MRIEVIKEINNLYAAGNALEAESLLYEASKNMSNAEIHAVKDFTCQPLIKAFTFARDNPYVEDSLSDDDDTEPTTERAIAISAVVKRVVALREKGNEEAAKDALSQAVESGELTYREAMNASYLKDGEVPIAPSWEVTWSIERERLLCKAAGLPYEHINAL